MSARGLILCVLGLSCAASAQQRGVLLAPEALDVASRKALAADIAQARATSPQAFADLAAFRSTVKDLDARKRGPLAPFTLSLKAMGPDALLPMLEMIAMDAPARGDLPDSAWTGMRSALLEAVGLLRDPRAAPVLRAVLASDVTEHHVVRSATEALGKLGDDAAVAALVALGSKDGPKRLSVLTGIGWCRRAAVAELLERELGRMPEAAAEARALVRSLMDVGNSYAWAMPIVAASGEGARTRATAARALVAAFVAYEGEVRDNASKALLVVDDASTPSLIAAALRTATAAQRAALEALSVRFEHNPVRR